LIQSNIKFNTSGKVLSGKYKNWYIFIEDETKDDSGYTMYLTREKDIQNNSEGYDLWFYNQCELEANFQEYSPVQWLES